MEFKTGAYLSTTPSACAISKSTRTSTRHVEEWAVPLTLVNYFRLLVAMFAFTAIKKSCMNSLDGYEMLNC